LTSLQQAIKKGQAVNRAKIYERIGRIKQKNFRVAHYYQIEFKPYSFEYSIQTADNICPSLIKSINTLNCQVKQDKISYLQLRKKLAQLEKKYQKDYEKLSINLQEPEFSFAPLDEIQASKKEKDGEYILKTNRDDLSDENIWNMYMMLTRVEDAFRYLKSILKIRPNYHQLEERVDGHIFIRILAYNILHAVEYTLRQQDIHYSWPRIKRVLSTHTYSSIIMPTVSGKVIHLRIPGKPEVAHQEIYNFLRK